MPVSAEQVLGLSCALCAAVLQGVASVAVTLPASGVEVRVCADLCR
jgi:hypothetical protein